MDAGKTNNRTKVHVEFFCSSLQFKFNYKTQNMIIVSNDQRYFLGAKGTKAGLNILFASLEKIVTFVRFISFSFKG